MKEKTDFIVDKTKCTKCGNCIKTCSGMVLELGEDGYPEIKYHRGVQKTRSNKIHRYSKEVKQESLF